MPPQANAVNTEVVADTTATDPASVGTESEVVEDAFVQGMNSDVDPDSMPTVEDDEETEEEAPNEAEAEATETEETEAAQDDKGKPKEWDELSPAGQNRFRDLANQNRMLREQIAANQARQTQVATEQELLNKVNPDTGDYYTPQEAERVARYQANEQYQQNLAQEQFSLQVQQNQQQLTAEAHQSLQEFPELDAQSDKYDPETAQAFEAALQQALVIDPKSGMPIGAHISPYVLAKSIVAPTRVVAQRAKTLGQAEAQKATRKMLASADAAPSSSGAQPKGKEDPFLAGFNSGD